MLPPIQDPLARGTFTGLSLGPPLGDQQMLGFCAPLWAMTLPPTPDDEWNRNLAIVAAELAKGGGTSMR